MSTTSTTHASPYSLLRDLRRAGVSSDAIRADWVAVLGELDDPEAAETLAARHLALWPSCACLSGCTEAATTIEPDGGDLSCVGCCDYCCDDEGTVHCAACDDDVESVIESCGAGTQTRSYYRVRAPEMPETDPDGEWALYWETVGDDAHVVTRFGTRGDAEQALAATDWPRPGDHTPYLCGYQIRQWVDGAWTLAEED